MSASPFVPSQTPPPLVPRPLTDVLSAFDTASLFVHPAEASNVCLLLDDDRRPLLSLVVDGGGAHAVDDIADLLAAQLIDRPQVAGVVLVSHRPHDPVVDADVDRLFDLLARFDRVGVELVDWLVLSGDSRVSMTACCGLPSRW